MVGDSSGGRVLAGSTPVTPTTLDILCIVSILTAMDDVMNLATYAATVDFDAEQDGSERKYASDWRTFVALCYPTLTAAEWKRFQIEYVCHKGSLTAQKFSPGYPESY